MVNGFKRNETNMIKKLCQCGRVADYNKGQYCMKHWFELLKRTDIKKYEAIKEKRKQYAKWYNSKPEVIERRRRYNSTPDSKEYQKEYHSRPEQRERARRARNLKFGFTRTFLTRYKHNLNWQHEGIEKMAELYADTCKDVTDKRKLISRLIIQAKKRLSEKLWVRNEQMEDKEWLKRSSTGELKRLENRRH